MRKRQAKLGIDIAALTPLPVIAYPASQAGGKWPKGAQFTTWGM
jgi:hypothetical protein